MIRERELERFLAYKSVNFVNVSLFTPLIMNLLISAPIKVHFDSETSMEQPFKPGYFLSSGNSTWNIQTDYTYNR